MTNNSNVIGYAFVSANSTGKFAWATPLLTNDTYTCAPQAAVLDTCGWAYASIACGPEPLSLENYLFKLNATDGSVAYSSTVFGSGCLTALMPSDDDNCSVLYTTTSARDAPGMLAVLNATNGAVIENGIGPARDLLTGFASLSLLPNATSGNTATATAAAPLPSSDEASNPVLVVGGNAAWPYVGSFSVGNGTAVSGSDPWLTPTWNTSSGGPNGWVGGHSPVQALPPIILPDGSVVAGADPQASGTVNVLYRIFANGTLAWVTNLTSSGSTGYISGLAYSSTIDIIFVTVEYPGSQSANLWYLSGKDGSLQGPGCSIGGLCCDPTIMRGLAVDTRSDGTVWVWFPVITYWPSGNGPQGTMMDGYIQGSRFTTGSCSATSAIMTNTLPGGGPLTVPLPMPWIAPGSSGLLPYRFPTVAVGPVPGMVSVLVPAAGLMMVVPWTWPGVAAGHNHTG